MKSYIIRENQESDGVIGEYFMSTEMLAESIERREQEIAENKKIRKAALSKPSAIRGEILEKNPELNISLNPKDIVQEWSQRLLGNMQAYSPEMMRYVEVYGQFYRLKDLCVLNAHGNVKKEVTRTGKPKHTWAYQNNGKYYSIQGAIDSLDGQFSALGLFLCYYNHDFNLSSRKSLLILPDRDIEIAELEGTPSICEVAYYLYDPNFKEKKDRIITKTTIESALKELEKRNQTRIYTEEAKRGLEEID